MIQSNELTAKMVKLAEKNGVLDKVYGAEVNRLVRLKYSSSEEFALVWASQSGEKTAEVAAFKAYRNECKEKARATINALLNENI